MPWFRGSPNSNPFSSSAHLILIPALNGWPDQGQFTDLMVRLGTLLAILNLFLARRDQAHQGRAAPVHARGSAGRRARDLYRLATVPAIASVVAWNSILYAILIVIADMLRPQNKSVATDPPACLRSSA